MTFSEFAKMMHRYIFTEKSESKFLIELIGKVMEDPFVERDKEEEIKDNYNPMCNYNNESALRKIYIGTGKIAKRSVNKILSHIDEAKFSDYINEVLSMSAKEDLDNELKKNYDKYDIACDTGENCASLFKAILYNISIQSTKNTQRNALHNDEVSTLQKVNISEEFQAGIYDYNIKDFLESSPNNFPYSSIVEDALSFVNHINDTQKYSDIDRGICKEIITFNDILFEYLNFLKCNAAEVANFPLFFKLKSDDAIILDEAEKYLSQLKPMCQEIQAKIDLIHQDIHEKQVAELKEKDKEALENRLSNLKRKS